MRPTRNPMEGISRTAWQESLDDWSIVDCAIRSRSSISVLARRFPAGEFRGWDHEIPTRLVQMTINGESAEISIGKASIENIGHPKLGVSLNPIAQNLVFTPEEFGSVYATGSGQRGLEKIAPDLESPGIKRIVCINGWAYAVGLLRQVYKRVEIGRWEKLPEEGLFARGFSGESPAWMGFRDMDGPSEQCLYAVGGHGEVFLFDGRQWRQCDFPSNEQLATVTVAPNGDVYITGEAGNIWLGKEDTWTLIHRGDSSILNRDSVWFNDMLWVSSDYQTRVVQGGKVLPIIYEGEPQWLAGHMDARDGVLVIAGQQNVRMFDGNHWHWLIQPYE